MELMKKNAIGEKNGETKMEDILIKMTFIQKIKDQNLQSILIILFMKMNKFLMSRLRRKMFLASMQLILLKDKIIK
jgi:hypothetical protein